jgi:phosphohistidine phosphatase
MKLVLFRHGPAGRRDAQKWPDDRERPLTGIGKKRTRKAAQGIARLEPKISRIWTSPLVRARETAERLAQAYDPPLKITVVDALAPGMDPLRDLISESRRAPDDTIALVGHEPDLGALAGRLVGRDTSPLPLKKAGACAIASQSLLKGGACELLWFLPPGELRRLGKKKKHEGS